MTKQEIITPDGEVIETGIANALDTRLVSELAKAEIDQQIATAHRYPRSVSVALKNIKSLATLDDEAAAECIYALPRGGKPIRGPSIRLAEIIANQWRNCRVAARVVDVNREEKYVEAEGVFHDLETNVATKATVWRRIVDSKGRLYNDDMIIVTGNAACSIARRNAILAGVPKAVWRSAYDTAEQVIKGDLKTLSERRARAVAAFGTWGVTAERVFAAIGVRGEEEITLDHLPTLFGMFQAIKNGEETVESLFNAREGAKPHTKVANPLDDETPARKVDAPKQTTEPSPDALAGSPGDEAGEDPGDTTSPADTDAPRVVQGRRGAEGEANPAASPSPSPASQAGDAAGRSGEGDLPSPEDIAAHRQESASYDLGYTHAFKQKRKEPAPRDPEWDDDEANDYALGFRHGKAARERDAAKEG